MDNHFYKYDKSLFMINMERVKIVLMQWEIMEISLNCHNSVIKLS